MNPNEGSHVREKACLRLEVAQQCGGNRAHPLTVAADAVAVEAKCVQDMEERPLTLGSKRVRLHMRYMRKEVRTCPYLV